MTNFDCYKDALLNANFAVVNEKPTACLEIQCGDCLFGGNCCDEGRWEWLKAEYVEPEVDWSRVKVDAQIFVSNDGEHWHKRHFARFAEGVVYAWCTGATSWSAVDDTDVMSWKCARLVEENDG